MKACIVQPPYSTDLGRSDELFAYKLQKLDECDASVDIIVLPEYSDVPCATATREDTLFYHKKYLDTLLQKCIQTARRCQALVFVNALCPAGESYRNTTYVYDRRGELVGKYFKRHLPPLEQEVLALDSDYTQQFSAPYVLELEGLRFGFMTCYDFYFYEAFANLARQEVDIIIGCSLQRSDSHEAIETMCRFLAYNTNAYVLRSSVSFREDATICGASMAVSPYGGVLGNMQGRFGVLTVEFDPRDKHLKPAGYGNPPASHHSYIEYGRSPWQYRPAGPAMIQTEQSLGYPRVCAHRGFSLVAPENSMPAFGAAVALGAEEIELDLWPTADGHIVSIHDRRLDRVSNGTGRVTELTLAQLREFDFGVKFGDQFQGLGIVTFEQILQKFAGQVILNVHVKPLSHEEDYPQAAMEKIVGLLRAYGAERHAYLMLETDAQIRQFKAYAPDIPICVGHLGKRPWEIVDRAIRFGCQKVQLFKPYYSREMIQKAHAHGIRCNIFWSDDPEEARQFLDLGVDTILSNDYLRIANTVKR